MQNNLLNIVFCNGRSLRHIQIPTILAYRQFAGKLNYIEALTVSMSGQLKLLSRARSLHQVISNNRHRLKCRIEPHEVDTATGNTVYDYANESCFLGILINRISNTSAVHNTYERQRSKVAIMVRNRLLCIDSRVKKDVCDH